jgi:CheY-like chemotaxis protein
VLIFSNGQKGFDYLLGSLKNPKDIPNYIFLDINMPIMDGWQFLEEFSSIEDKFTKNVNIYLVTSSIDERDIEKATKFTNVKEYLVKPISENKILEVFGR